MNKNQTPKIVRAALTAREQGYENIASVVKQHYSTTYYHVVSVADVIAANDWPRAPRGLTLKNGNYAGGAAVGTKDLPEKTIMRKTALAMVD